MPHRITVPEDGVVFVGPGGIEHARVDETGVVGAGGGSLAWADITDKPATFAPSSHSHPISEIASLQVALDAKAASGHTHTELPTPGQKNALAGTQGTPGATNQYVTTQDSRLSDARTPTSHSHPQSEITNLVADLASKAPTSHTHTASQVSDFNSAGDARWAPIGSGSGDSIVKLTSDVASTQTALANTTGLAFNVTNGTLYRFEAFLVYRTAALTTGIRIGVTVPNFTVYAANVRISNFAADGAGAEFLGSLSSSGDSVLTTAVAAATTDAIAVIEGILLPSANGSVQVQHATEVAGSAATIRTGSHIAYRAI